MCETDQLESGCGGRKHLVALERQGRQRPIELNGTIESGGRQHNRGTERTEMSERLI